MKKIKIPSVDNVISTNKYISIEGGTPHQCLDRGKIESALHTAFYPGSYPFTAGGIAKVAAVLCFYLVKSHPFIDGNKRTGALVAIGFLNINGWDLQYPLKSKSKKSELAFIIEKCAASEIDKEELMDWFESHKVKLK